MIDSNRPANTLTQVTRLPARLMGVFRTQLGMAWRGAPVDVLQVVTARSAGGAGDTIAQSEWALGMDSRSRRW
jgi:hypothetical protein